MDLQQLKSVWLAYDEKMLANRKLSELVVFGMIKDKSKGILVRMQNEILRVCFLCFGLITFFSASIVGNAFDFTQPIQYVPLLLYIGFALVALLLLLREYRRLKGVNMTKDTLYEALKKLIELREKFQAVVNNVWFLIPLTSLVFLISLTAKTVDKYGAVKWASIVFALVAATILFVLVTRRYVRVFKDSYCEELKENLRELEEMQQM